MYFRFVSEDTTQADFQAAATGGQLSLLVLMITGTLLRPMGEQFVFRSIIANALNRYGIWAGLIGSAVIFGVAHGLNVILLDAFMVGILTGLLFYNIGSLVRP